MSETKFAVDYSKRLSKCKKCKTEIAKGSIRIAKLVPNFFGGDDNEDSEMKQFYHIKCIFETFQRARATTKIIESTDDIQGFGDIEKDDQKAIIKLVDENEENRSSKSKTSKPSSSPDKPKKSGIAKAITKQDSDTDIASDEEDTKKKPIKRKTSSSHSSDEEVEVKKPLKGADTKSVDNKFETFSKICDEIASDSSHLKKTAILKKFFNEGINGDGYKGDMYIFLKLLLPTATNRVFNLNSKQLIKLYSKIFGTNLDDMNDHLNKGDVSDTCRSYFSKSNTIKPAASSTLSIFDVDNYLDKLTKVTKENDQLDVLEEITKKCTKKDLVTFIRLIKKDLRIDAGAKNILEAISPNAYAAFQVSRDLKDVVKRVNDLKSPDKSGKPSMKKDLSIRIKLMTPVKPMLAEACKSVEQAFAKCKNGVLCEIKYDGERLQVHKSGSSFSYFSRNLKAVQPHKVAHLKEFIPKAFPDAKELILDGEVLLYDSKTKKPLPFGTLGVHKKNAFKDATVCLFVFDCIYMNGEDLMNKPLDERRKILSENMTEIPGRIMFSDQKKLTKMAELRKIMMDVINEGLEGLVLKDTKSIYEPGKRHWLKMKKDYLDSGTMADTADLVVLGAYYGTGNKGGMRSVFLMGSYNEKTSKWHTVTKVGNGFDDKTLAKLQTQIDMVEIKKNYSQVPDWLVINKTIVPDFVVKNPKNSPVWELTGAEFSKSDVHTADGISIRFPRVTKVRDDKTWKEATNLERLKKLFTISKEKTDIKESSEESSPVKNNKKTARKRHSSPSESSSSESEEEKTPVKKNKITTGSLSSAMASAGAAAASALPNLFEDIKFFLSDSVPKKDELKRYIIAYDGELIDSVSIDEATYIVLSTTDEKLPDDCKPNKKAKELPMKSYGNLSSKKKLNKHAFFT